MDFDSLSRIIQKDGKNGKGFLEKPFVSDFTGAGLRVKMKKGFEQPEIFCAAEFCGQGDFGCVRQKAAE